MGIREDLGASLLIASSIAESEATLTDREHMLLQLLAGGLTNAQIGQRVHRSEKTVRNQLTRVYEKLGAGNRAEAAALYCRRHHE